MLKKMRWRFIGSAMAAFTAVVLILLLVINLWNYGSVVRQQDDSLNMLYQLDTQPSRPPTGSSSPFPGAFPAFSPEVQYMIRFFSVYCDGSRQVQRINQDYIASVSQSDAAAYAAHILEGGKLHGFYTGYRYAVFETETGSAVLFLNSERELQSMKSLLLKTGLIAVCCLITVFILVILFSKRAIAPYVRNIETQKRFITDASHELKTPLTAISASADVLASEYEGDEWIQNIQSQSLKMAKLIGNLVALSGLDEEQPFPEKAEFSLSDAAWEISEPMAALAQAKSKEYIQHIEDGIVMLGDKAAIQQMLSILLDNAIKYSDEHGKIRLDVVRQKRKIHMVVYNTCQLTQRIDTQRLFERFYRADEAHSGEIKGTGIGLSIAKATVLAHGGKITAQCVGGSGMELSVWV